VVALHIPADTHPADIAKSKFVHLLEYVEEYLACRGVLAVFPRAGFEPAKGFATTLRYIGFQAVDPSKYPRGLHPDHHFLMYYRT